MSGRRRVLLAWEQGRGFGHTTQLAQLGRRLRAAGAEVAAAVRFTELSRPLVEAGIRLIQAPVWPDPAPRPGDALPASATLTDTLARLGLRDPDGVATVLRGWRAILDAERPDLMVCDYSPLAAVAARGRCRIMQAGTAYCLPPSNLAEMPLQHDFAPPRHTDAEVMGALNTALAGEGMAPLERIGALFAGDDVFVRTFPLIDPYADLRTRDAEGPVLAAPIGPAREDARTVFAYLHPEVAGRADVLAALVALGPALEIHVPRAGSLITGPLATAGARVHERPVAIGAALAGSRLVLHQGSAGIASEALLAGVPQFTLSLHVEHYLNAEALAAAGVSRHVPLFDPAARLAGESLRAMYADEDALMLARAAGEMHRALMTPDPLEVLTARTLALL